MGGDALIVVAAGHADTGDDRAIRRIDGGELATGGIRDPIAIAGAGIDRFNFQTFQNFVCSCSCRH